MGKNICGTYKALRKRWSSIVACVRSKKQIKISLKGEKMKNKGQRKWKIRLSVEK